MPTVYEAAFLSRYIYGTDEHLLPPGWKVQLNSEQLFGGNICGYKAALFVHEGKKEAVIAHRGTEAVG